MIRSELIQKIADENPHLYQRDVERIVNTIFEEIIEGMSRGDRVELRGFGAFSVKKRDRNEGRHDDDTDDSGRKSASDEDAAGILAIVANEFGKDTASRSKETLNYVRKVSDDVKQGR